MKKIFWVLCLMTTSFIGIKAQSLEKIVNDKETILVDVRTPEEFAQGNVKNSVNIPIQELEARLNELQGKKNIVLFCRSGRRSAEAEKILKEKGFNNVSDGKTWQNVNAMLKPKYKKDKKHHHKKVK